MPAATDKSYYMFLEDFDSSNASSDNSSGSTGSTADLETFQYLNNKDTSLKSLKFIVQYKKILVCTYVRTQEVTLLWCNKTKITVYYS